jgi:gas vesicle protein
MNTLRLSVTALTLIAVSAAVALLLAPKRRAERREDLLRSAAKAGRTVGGRVTKVMGSASRVLAEDRPLVGGARADDRADLLAQSQDMVAEGGPAGA